MTFSSFQKATIDTDAHLDSEWAIVMHQGLSDVEKEMALYRLQETRLKLYQAIRHEHLPLER